MLAYTTETVIYSCCQMTHHTAICITQLVTVTAMYNNFIIIYTYPHGLINAFFFRIIILMFSCGILRFQIINTCVRVCLLRQISAGQTGRQEPVTLQVCPGDWCCALSLFESVYTSPEGTFAPRTEWSLGEGGVGRRRWQRNRGVSQLSDWVFRDVI